jgi:hypothetical protein
MVVAAGTAATALPYVHHKLATAIGMGTILAAASAHAIRARREGRAGVHVGV